MAPTLVGFWTFQHRHPGAALQSLRQGGQRPAAHGAQHAPGQLEAGELRQHVKGGGVDGDIPHPGEDLLRLAADVPVLHQHGDRLIAPIQGPLHDLRALCDEDAFLGVLPVQELILGFPGKNIQRRVGKIGDLDDVGHGGAPFS